MCGETLYIEHVYEYETVLFVDNSSVDFEIISILLGMRESVLDAVSYRIETFNKRFAFRSLWTPSGGARSWLTAVQPTFQTTSSVLPENRLDNPPQAETLVGLLFRL
jgi:hypothetical protein